MWGWSRIWGRVDYESDTNTRLRSDESPDTNAAFGDSDGSVYAFTSPLPHDLPCTDGCTSSQLSSIAGKKHGVDDSSPDHMFVLATWPSVGAAVWVVDLPFARLSSSFFCCASFCFFSCDTHTHTESIDVIKTGFGRTGGWYDTVAIRTSRNNSRLHLSLIARAKRDRTHRDGLEKTGKTRDGVDERIGLKETVDIGYKGKRVR